MDAPGNTPDYAALEFPEAPADRPYVIVNMVASVDGKTVIEGSERGLGSAADRRLLRELRVHADIVLTGAGTLRASGHSPRLNDEALEALRVSRGKPRLPIAATLSRSGDLPLDNRFFSGQRLRGRPLPLGRRARRTRRGARRRRPPRPPRPRGRRGALDARAHARGARLPAAAARGRPDAQRRVLPPRPRRRAVPDRRPARGRRRRRAERRRDARPPRHARGRAAARRCSPRTRTRRRASCTCATASNASRYRHSRRLPRRHRRPTSRPRRARSAPRGRRRRAAPRSRGRSPAAPRSARRRSRRACRTSR